MTELPIWLVVALALAGPTIGVVGVLVAQAVGRNAELGRLRSELHLSGMAAAYLELADFVVRLRALATSAAPGRSAEVSAFATQLGEDRWWSVHAGVSAYGSKAIRDRFGVLLQSRIELAGSLSTWEEVLEMSPPYSKDELAVLDNLRDRRESLAQDALTSSGR